MVDRKLHEFLQRRFPAVAGGLNDGTDLIGQFPWYVRLLASPMRGRLAITAMRLLWRPPRWFAQQHKIGHKHGQSRFRALTRAFQERSEKTPNRISTDEIRQLLVDAFVEDLRRAYRRTTVLGRGHRRRAYPVLLLDGVTSDSREFDLIRCVAKARDTAGRRLREPKPYRSDPLLIIALGDEAARQELRRANDPQDRELTVADPTFAEDLWWDRMRRYNQFQSWLLTLTVPPYDLDEPGARQRIGTVPLPVIWPPVALAVAAAVVVATVSVVGVNVYHYRCGSWYWEPDLTLIDDQCIGLAPDSYEFFADIPKKAGLDDTTKARLREVEARIRTTNKTITGTQNDYLTVAYLSTLTPDTSEGYATELEQLTGLSIAQEELLKGNQPIRILLANAGAGMNKGKLAADAIAEEAENDPSLVAVLGLGISRDGTRDAMIRLGDAGIPMIGTLLSATEMAEKTTAYYHQAGPTNKREAAVAAHYARSALKLTRVRIYYSGDSHDLYSTDLMEQARQEFQTQGIRVDLRPYKAAAGQTGNDVGTLGREACDTDTNHDGVSEDDIGAFYAGRAEEMPAFLNGMKMACEGDYPQIIAGDDAIRYVLTGDVARFPGLTLDYLSFASSLAWGPDCGAALDTIAFFRAYQGLTKSACEDTRDGSAIMAFDTLLVFAQAAGNAPHSDGMPTRDAILAGVNDIRVQSKGIVKGVSGDINYARPGSSVPTGKTMLILRANGKATPTRVLLCGSLSTAQPPPDTNRCPADPE